MFYFGVNYYPEHWPEERWTEDAKLMAEAGFNVVRLAEFAWSKMEPRAGHYDFDWLDRAISILASHDIQVVLGTPTASPPPWLMTKYPDIFRVREDGRRVTFGNRREYCPNNPAYHDYTRRIVTQMAEHYADHPAVIGWQIDNEFGDRCYCPVCTQSFQTWLRDRHGSLDTLNQKWGTVFWSHTYTDWGEIPLPLTTGSSPNPGLALDFCRFSSDSYVAYQQMQIDILREKCPQHFITHNFMGFKYDRIDYFDLARPLDFAALNHYPRTQWDMQAEVDASLAALAADTIRGLKSHNFWMTEQQAGSGGWEIVSVAPRPGELRLWAYQSIAHGADAIIFFRWRTARFGTEQYWHGLLDHDGSTSRRYEEIKRMGAEIKKAGERIHSSIVRPAVAMMLSYDSRFAFQIQANNPQFNYPEHFHQFYRALYDRHIAIDIVAPTAGLSDYKLVVVPALHVVSEAVAENLKRFVEAGGVLVVTQRGGVKDEANTVVNQRLPGLLAELCGVEVEEYDSLSADMQNELEFALPKLASNSPVPVSTWCDVLKLDGADVVARYTQDYYAGKPAITLNRFAQGQVVYVGALGDARLYETLSGWLLDLVGVQAILTVPEGVEVTERWQGDRRLLFVLNHTEREQEIALEGRYADLLNG
ncbi:MAG: beta-galactosidase, partial [Nitrospira sp.]|nr:beta-galactosidase [Nitrospira sp.]